MPPSKTRLTKRAVDAIEPVPGKKTFVWDDDVPGFGICTSQMGSREATSTYILQYRNARGQSRRMSLGKTGAITPDQARQIAQKRLLEISQGADPLADKRAGREDLSFEEFAKRYMEEWSRKKKKPSTHRNNESLLRNHIKPSLKTKKLRDIQRDDVKAIRRKLEGTPSQANRALALLSHMFNWAEDEGLRDLHTNPCKGIKDFPETKRTRHLQASETRSLGEVLRKYEPYRPEAVLAIRLFLTTGMRMNEVLGLAWSMVDFDKSELTLLDSKTGKREDVVLSQAAMNLLAEAPRRGPWVVPSPGNPEKHMVNLNKTWHAIREEAGIADAWIHDLRRTCGSVGIQSGVSMEMVKEVLGHKDLRTTQAHYAHMVNAPVHQAADFIGDLIADELAGGPGRDAVVVVPGRTGSADSAAAEGESDQQLGTQEEAGR